MIVHRGKPPEPDRLAASMITVWGPELSADVASSRKTIGGSAFRHLPSAIIDRRQPSELRTPIQEVVVRTSGHDLPSVQEKDLVAAAER